MTPAPPPVAKRVPHEFTVHGTRIQDPYHWLKWRDWPSEIRDRDILAYIDDENAYFDDFTRLHARHIDAVVDELKGMMQLTQVSTYTKVDDYYYYSRTDAHREYALYCRKHLSENGREEILLDVNRLVGARPFVSVDAFAICPRHARMAYSVDFTGSERYQVFVVCIATNAQLSDPIPDTIGDVVWHERANGFFYTPCDSNWRRTKVMFHTIGTRHVDDRCVYTEKDASCAVSVRKTSDRRLVIIQITGPGSSESHYISMDDDDHEVPTLLKRRVADVFYTVDHGTNGFYMHTNDRAGRFRMLVAPHPSATSTGSTKRLRWRELVAEDPRKYLVGYSLTKRHILLNYRLDGLPVIVVSDLGSGEARRVALPDVDGDESHVASGYSANYEDCDLRIDYSSLTHPDRTYRYDFGQNTVQLLKMLHIPGGFDSAQYTCRRIFARSDDVDVPVTVLYKTALFRQDGSCPVYLYGYGAYGHAIPPTFNNMAVALANRGFVYAIAHVRGGDDMGREWYTSATLLTKKRTFDDFIAVAEALIARQYTSKGQIVVAGRSAGGMLVGSVVNTHPDLFKAAIAHVPFVDVLNTMLDERLPLTVGEFKEWGNPTDLRFFEYIRSYSPYDNVKRQRYPHILVTASIADPRVGYWEPAKWVARLRRRKTDRNLVILKTSMHAGHGGATSVDEYLTEVAEEIVFVLHVLGRLDH